MVSSPPVVRRYNAYPSLEPDDCLDELARVICADDETHLHNQPAEDASAFDETSSTGDNVDTGAEIHLPIPLLYSRSYSLLA